MAQTRDGFSFFVLFSPLGGQIAIEKQEMCCMLIVLVSANSICSVSGVEGVLNSSPLWSS